MCQKYTLHHDHVDGIHTSRPRKFSGQPTVKFSTGGASRGGIVTSIGDEMPIFQREDSFESLDRETSTNPTDTTAHNESRPLLQRLSSVESGSFSFGGEDGETTRDGYWGRQQDPASGMTYYLNDKVELIT